MFTSTWSGIEPQPCRSQASLRAAMSLIRPTQRALKPGRRWRGLNPRQKDPRRSQGGLANHSATDAPMLFGFGIEKDHKTKT
ncbi:hypothetical protein PoB_001025700 [Plakobranchus ocellatus]|uniref:Uncharacterized protein n=1 Tax=Plakobranchus ocellatus TaxID=259542 RepID=A0AAV3YNP1_9GAST|nr:hypothetical protein PoB_001025700 [Plakobranchus ocellatus]